MINSNSRIVFLCSSQGGNLSFLWNAIKRDFLPGFEVVGVISDRECGANEYAKKIGIFNVVTQPNDNKSINLDLILEQLNPDFIVTTIHLKISNFIIEKYGEKLINIHYSLLPAFGGLIGKRAVESAINYNSLIGGITIHEVTKDLDGGKPLSQIAFALHERENLTELMSLVFRCGCLGLLGTLLRIFKNNSQEASSSFVEILNRRCLVSGFQYLPFGIEKDEGFWSSVKEMNSN